MPNCQLPPLFRILNYRNLIKGLMRQPDGFLLSERDQAVAPSQEVRNRWRAAPRRRSSAAPLRADPRRLSQRLVLVQGGHRVTMRDMAGCGASPGRGEEVPSFEEYSRPLLDVVAALPEGEKAFLVAHSFGGQSLALAMERYPEKVAVAVFVTATMPAAGKPMTYAFKQLSQGKGSDFFMDCTLGSTGDPQNPDKTFLFGPEYMARRVYQLSPSEYYCHIKWLRWLTDLTLAIAMVRPSRRFLNDETMRGNVLTAERYGAVRRVYVVAEDDEWKPAEMQRLMASWNPGTEVMELQGADHMPMFSKPRELSELLMEIANK